MKNLPDQLPVIQRYEILGEIVETGTHAQLIKKENGIYCNLSELQFVDSSAYMV